MGRPRALVAVVAGAFLLAGCGSGPAQVGAAAIVGDTAISLDHVQELIDKAVSEQPYARKLAAEHKLDELGRAIVSELVDEELIVQTARQEGVVADQGQVAQAMKSNPVSAPVPETADPSTGVAEVLARVFDRRDVLTKLNLQQQLANKMAANLEITFDYLVVNPQPNPNDPTAQQPDPARVRAQAISIARQIASDPAAATKAIEDQVKQAKAQNQQAGAEAGVKATLGDAPNFDTTPLFWTPQNNVVVFPQPSDQSTGWFVAAIHKRSTTGVTSAKKQPLTADQANGVSTRRVQEYARKTNVKVNPRYGVWDVVGMSVAQNLTVDSTVVVPFGTPAPAGQ